MVDAMPEATHSEGWCNIKWVVGTKCLTTGETNLSPIRYLYRAVEKVGPWPMFSETASFLVGGWPKTWIWPLAAAVSIAVIRIRCPKSATFLLTQMNFHCCLFVQMNRIRQFVSKLTDFPGVKFVVECPVLNSLDCEFPANLRKAT
jgi:hypothetical protein